MLTLVALALILWAVPGLLNWLFFDAVWTGADRTACLTTVQGGALPEGWSGACWAFVGDRFEQLMFGRYPLDERWRPMLVAALSIALLIRSEERRGVRECVRRGRSRCAPSPSRKKRDYNE